MASERCCQSCRYSPGAVEMGENCPQCGATLDGEPRTAVFVPEGLPTLTGDHLAAPPSNEWDRATATHAPEPPPPLGETVAIEVEQVAGEDATRTEAPPQQNARVLTPEDYSFLSPAEGPGELGRLGKYRIFEQLGAGGMGTVFRAEDVNLRRTVALKVMTDARSFDPVARARFVREARALATLDSEHVVTVHDVGDDRGVLYLCMALLKGENLQDRMDREKRLSIARAVRVARQVASGLAAAHDAGLVHRDVKPSNIWLVAGSDQAKLIDFGLARITDVGAGLTVTRAVMGTPAYMAPEQVRSSKHVDLQADQFALGCVLYEMLVGINPFRDRSKLGTFRRILDHTPPSPDSLDTAIPAELGEVVLRLLQKAPADRFESTHQVVEALDAIAANLGPDAAKASSSTTLVNVNLLPLSRRSRRWPRRVVAGIACVAVAAAAFAIVSQPPPTPQQSESGMPPSDDVAQAEKLARRKVFENSVGMGIVLIPEGTFTQGSPSTEPGRKADEGPQRKVRISQPFYLGQYEVTVGEFRRFTDASGYRTFAERPGSYAFRLNTAGNSFQSKGGYTWREPRWEQTDRHPVVCVNWDDAIAFCLWLSRKDSRIYRLASDAEWERAIRGGTTTAYYTGDKVRKEDARTSLVGLSEPTQVGEYPANPFGLHDMIGNVDEWVLDSYEQSYREEDRLNPLTWKGKETRRSVRGASYTWGVADGRSASRGHSEPPHVPADRTGFRVAAEPIPSELPDADERAAAEILLRNGAALEVAVGTETKPVTRGDDLPAANFRVDGLTFDDIPWFTGEHLAWAVRLSGLTHLRMRTARAGEELAKYVGRLRTLTHLTVGPYSHGDALLSEVGGLSKLQELSLEASVSDTQSIRHLEKLPALKALTLTGKRLGDDAVERLGQLKGLTRLQLVGTTISDNGLAKLKSALPTCEIESKATP